MQSESDRKSEEMSRKILMIETSTDCCSAALAIDGKIVSSRVNDAPKVHASMLAPYVDEILKEAGCRMPDCDAVAVSEGPGSYTGLRVGVSTAKGLCFGAGVPLIGVDTLSILAHQAEGKYDFIVPMIDARRMEVYCAVFDGNAVKVSETEAKILDSNSFSELLDQGTVLFIGDGVDKFREVCKHSGAHFQSCRPLAEAMTVPATEALAKKEFKDVAYFEPFYLKEFVAGISKKSVL